MSIVSKLQNYVLQSSHFSPRRLQIAVVLFQTLQEFDTSWLEMQRATLRDERWGQHDAGGSQACAARRHLRTRGGRLRSSGVKTSCLRRVSCQQAGVVWIVSSRGVAYAPIKPPQICCFHWLGNGISHLRYTNSDNVSSPAPSSITRNRFHAHVPLEVLGGFQGFVGFSGTEHVLSVNDW